MTILAQKLSSFEGGGFSRRLFDVHHSTSSLWVTTTSPWVSSSRHVGRLSSSPTPLPSNKLQSPENILNQTLNGPKLIWSS